MRGSVIGTLPGLVPGMTGSASSFLSYIAEKKVKDVVDAAKANPKKVTISTTGIQNDEAFAILQFQKMTGAQFAMVHFAQGVASAMTAFLVGKIDVLCANVGDLLAQFKSGEVRILGIMDDETSPFYPGVKTFEQQGCKLYNSSSRGFAAPAGTPTPSRS